MTIREELLSEGYTDEYIDKASKNSRWNTE